MDEEELNGMGKGDYSDGPIEGWADEHHLVRNAEFQLRQ